MHKPESNCDHIVQKMAQVLTDQASQIGFVQDDEVEVRIDHTMEKYVSWRLCLRERKAKPPSYFPQ